MIFDKASDETRSDNECARAAPGKTGSNNHLSPLPSTFCLINDVVTVISNETSFN